MLLITCIWLRLFLLFHINLAQTIVKTLPGYPGILPFNLETGYVGVGENEELQLFYYFIRSEGNSARDPLVLWLSGGPGCSGFSGLVYEIGRLILVTLIEHTSGKIIHLGGSGTWKSAWSKPNLSALSTEQLEFAGPLAFNYEAFDGSIPSFVLNPYAWTMIASIIFLDSPVGTGFSYSTTSEGYYSSDTKAAKDAYGFLQKWLLRHPEFLKNPLYIGGDSYSGKIVPSIVLSISEGNEAGLRPHMSIKGYVMGNPLTINSERDYWKVPFAHRMGLISDEYYKLAKSSCHEKYVYPDSQNLECLLALQFVEQCISNINPSHILEPKCLLISPKPNKLKWDETYLEDDSVDILLPSYQEMPWCRDKNYVLSSVWANNPTVREALQVRNGTKEEWLRCNWSLPYDKDSVASVVDYHQLLSTKRGLRALIYSGDHDLMVPHIGTLAWIKDLNLTLNDDWRPWLVNGQIAGYTMMYNSEGHGFFLTFATVKGAGHTAPEYKPKECLAMIERWLSVFPL